MFYRTLLDAKTALTLYSAIFDFAQDLAIGETLASAGVTATVYSGTDGTPSAILSGIPTISGKQVVQTIIDGVVGVTYYLTANAITSLGQPVQRVGFLVVVPE